MTINFRNALGIHPDTLNFRSARAEILANNLINADTPNFKARDISFEQTLKEEMVRPVRLATTNQRHIHGSEPALNAELQYRNPLQPAVDGNTVDADLEESEYMKNALEFQTSFTFLNSKFKGLKTAIRGE
ncbi:MAG: flagellar basal body rod protein FlgB [Pseudomonadales bacterium]|nr:flagellar basal body rod protein FlgB [Pseudomonadales bacterium]